MDSIQGSPKKNALMLRWLLLMAWRDSRRNKSRLFLFVSSIILGIAALVAIYALGDNLKNDIDKQAASLLGADLQVSSNKPFEPTIQGLLDSLGDERSEERGFASMIYFNKSGGTRLVQIKALKGGFPYYGALETQPATAQKAFKNQQGALVDKTLMLQFDAVVGDSIKVGNLSFAIVGTLLKAPGQTGLSSSVAPTVYIPLQFLEQTGLSQKGSRINYKYYYKYGNAQTLVKQTKNLEPRFEKEGISFETIETQKEQTGRSFGDLTNFLSLVGFIALLLGCVGVASSVNIYVREKINSIAILRCMGASGTQSFLIFIIQIVAIGFIGSVVGAALGTLLQQFLPLLLKDFIAIDISTNVSWIAIAQGIILGTIIAFLFSLLPLISLRKVSPLNTIRVSANNADLVKDKARWSVYIAIILFIIGFTYLQVQSWFTAFTFSAAILLAFLILLLIASLFMKLVRRFFPSSWSYLWRQGLANLYRPNNQTTILIVSIGLGTAFICTLFLVQTILIDGIKFSSGGMQPNMVLFDIQDEQKLGVTALTKQFNLPIIQEVPIVNMRLQKVSRINSNEKIKNELDSISNRRFMTREYRVTYRDSLSASEKVTQGKWYGKLNDNVIYVSLEERWAKKQNISIGDSLTFNVQGSLVSTLVGSFREVDWNRIQTNFLVVFPTGVLEDAPKFHVLLTKVKSDQASAQFQQAMVKQFPNVSIIDLGLVLSTLEEILSKISFVIQFMAGLSIVTGLVVLIASVLISKYQRMQESVLLRTLGASRKQILWINALEYFFLGALASLTGIAISLAASWALAKYTFKAAFSVALLPLVIITLTICLLTVLIGLLNSRSVLNRPPLEVLRQEV